MAPLPKNKNGTMTRLFRAGANAGLFGMHRAERQIRGKRNDKWGK